MKKDSTKKSQELRVLEILREARGEWVNKQVFAREYYFTQAGRAIHTLQNNKEKYGYEGVIESSRSLFRDEHNFCSYRLTQPQSRVLTPSPSQEKVEYAKLPL